MVYKCQPASKALVFYLHSHIEYHQLQNDQVYREGDDARVKHLIECLCNAISVKLFGLMEPVKNINDYLFDRGHRWFVLKVLSGISALLVTVKRDRKGQEKEGMTCSKGSMQIQASVVRI